MDLLFPCKNSVNEQRKTQVILYIEVAKTLKAHVIVYHREGLHA